MSLGDGDREFVAVKIWDTVGEDQVLKAEYKGVISGRMWVSQFRWMLLTGVLTFA